MAEDEERTSETQSLVNKDEEKGDKEYRPVNYLDKLKGFLAAAICVSMVTVSATCVQLLERRIPDFEVNTFRFFVSWILMVLILLVQRRMPRTEKFNISIFFLHAFCSECIALPHFIAITVSSVTSVQCLVITSGITSGIFIFLLALKEDITMKKLACAMLCITGVVLVIQPEVIFHYTEPGNITEILDESDSVFQNISEIRQNIIETFTSVNPVLAVLGLVLPVIAGISISSQTVVVKKFPFIGEDVIVTGFWTLMFCSIMSAILSLASEMPTWPQTWSDGLYICGHSVCYCMTWITGLVAPYYLSGNTVNIVYSTSVVLMLIPQYTVLSSIHPGHRNWIEVLGVVLVLFGSSLGSLLELLSGK